MDSYSVADVDILLRYNLLDIHHHENFLSTPVDDIVTSCVLFSISQTPLTSSNKFVAFNSITPIPDFTIAFVSQKDTKNSLKKSNSIIEDSYIYSAYEKSEIMRFRNDILQNLQGDTQPK